MRPKFTDLDVALFWQYARGFSWTEWRSFSEEERGVIVKAHHKLIGDEFAVPDAPVAPPTTPPSSELEEIPGITTH
jgi:hypothetical protein